MRNKFLFRQVALVGYGTKFLRNELALEDWYRHGVFFDARFQFRALEDNVLLADDFTLWLGVLARAGATRLSLHSAAEFGIALPRIAYEAGQVVVVHFADRYQIWASGVERASWSTAPGFPSAQAYAGEVDSYWLAEEGPGQPEVPSTNWKALAVAIAKDLEVTVPSSNVPAPAGPFFPHVRDDVDWARLPLFPYSSGTTLAHRIVATLDWQQGRFAHDTHPKNEGNLYNGLNEAGAEKLTQWKVRLDGWLVDSLLRSANE